MCLGLLLIIAFWDFLLKIKFPKLYPSAGITCKFCT